ncbi:hypothetical protein HDK77DRAFT_109829 [Phyllosticta capitalensis]|uniref:uncharacterized protein n=1 Tax=Phyllosticta capitalensis TaxID=121624 RepID=UPI00312FED06
MLATLVSFFSFRYSTGTGATSKFTRLTNSSGRQGCSPPWRLSANLVQLLVRSNRGNALPVFAKQMSAAASLYPALDEFRASLDQHGLEVGRINIANPWLVTQQAHIPLENKTPQAPRFSSRDFALAILPSFRFLPFCCSRADAVHEVYDDLIFQHSSVDSSEELLLPSSSPCQEPGRSSTAKPRVVSSASSGTS